MKKILTLTMGLIISLFASENFEDKHLKCTLIKKDGNPISLREAEGWYEFKNDVLVTSTTIKINSITYYYDKDEYYLDKAGIFRAHVNYDGKGLEIKMYGVKYSYTLEKSVPYFEEYKEYECTEATLLEKIKYKFSK